VFDLYEKRRLRRYLYSKPVIAVLLVLIGLLSTAVWNMYTKQRETAEKRAQLAQSLAELEQREASLESEIERLRTQRGVEKEIRERFNVAREGERVMVIVNESKPKETAQETEQNGFWSTVRNAIPF
jgi:cell division protein FtsB